jgi:uncharacterized C2H2 Zn-finger protein
VDVTFWAPWQLSETFNLDAFLQSEVALPEEARLSATYGEYETGREPLSFAPPETQDVSTSGGSEQHVETQCSHGGQLFSKAWRMRLVASSDISVWWLSRVDKWHARKHIKVKHTKSFKCEHPDCQKSQMGFGFKKDLERHINSVHPRSLNGSEVFVCPICGRSMPRSDNMERHIRKQHPRERRGPVERRLRA